MDDCSHRDYRMVVTRTTLGRSLQVVTVTFGYAVTMTEEIDGTVGIRELKARLSDFVNRVIYRNEIVYITKNGRRVAALVPVEAAEQYEAAQRRTTHEIEAS